MGCKLATSKADRKVMWGVVLIGHQNELRRLWHRILHVGAGLTYPEFNQGPVPSVSELSWACAPSRDMH